MNEDNRLDYATYDSSRTYLKSALEHMLAAGRSVRDLSEFALDKFGSDFLPYLQQFQREVRQGRINIDGLSRAARDAVLGHHVSDEQRDELIRQTAYLRAEQRGFTGGSPEQDWLEAEREVDTRLAQQAGLVVKGSKALASVTAVVEKELSNSRKVVIGWLDRKSPAAPAVEKKVAGRNKPAARLVRAGTAKRAAANARGQDAKANGKTASTRKAPVKGAATTPKRAVTTGKKTTASGRAASASRTGTAKRATATTGSRTGTAKRAAAATGTRTGTAKKKASVAAGARSGTKRRTAAGSKVRKTRR